MYPSWRYHTDYEPRIIYEESQEESGWVDSPAKCGLVAAAPHAAAPPSSSEAGMDFEPAPQESKVKGLRGPVPLKTRGSLAPNGESEAPGGSVAKPVKKAPLPKVPRKR